MTLLSTTQQQEIIEKLNNGEILILPTDTIYGLSAKVAPQTQKKINKLKHAPEDKELIILVSSLAMAANLVQADQTSLALLNSSPPTTVIYSAKQGVNQTLALRLVQRTDLQAIIEQTGPLYSTSVNHHLFAPLRSELDLHAFAPQVPIFYVGELNAQPSRIYNSLTGEYLR